MKWMRDVDKYMMRLKKLVLDFIGDRNVKVYLFGSRARGDNSTVSDVDIGILCNEEANRLRLFELKDLLEESTIPYKVDVINLSETGEDFREEIMKDAIIWKE